MVMRRFRRIPDILSCSKLEVAPQVGRGEGDEGGGGGPTTLTHPGEKIQHCCSASSNLLEESVGSEGRPSPYSLAGDLHQEVLPEGAGAWWRWCMVEVQVQVHGGGACWRCRCMVAVQVQVEG